MRCFLPSVCALLLVGIAALGQSGGVPNPGGRAASSAHTDSGHTDSVHGDLRNARWGMTPEQVRAAETGTPAETQGPEGLVLRYPTQDLLKTGTLSYFFVAGRLQRAVYSLPLSHDNLDLSIDDFHRVSQELMAQHPDRECDRVIWLDDSLQIERMPYLIQDRARVDTILPSDPQIGMSLSLGHFQMIEAWRSARTQISHTITGGDGRILHRVEFRSAEAPLDPAIAACAQQ